jgi:hypothetical protein
MAGAVDILIRLRQAREAARDADRVARSVRGVGTAAKTAGRDARKGERGIAVLRKSALGLGAVAGGVAAGGLYAFGRGAKYGIGAAVDLGEQINKTRVVFRTGSDEVLRFSDTTATSLGISQRAALEAAGNFGGLFTAFGIGRERAGDMSVRLVQLAADLASFNNASPEETLDALRSGLTGETEPLKRFQVVLNAARVEQEAMRLGLATTKSEISETAKAQATYSLILKQTKDQQGDFERTSGSLANRTKTLRAQTEDLAASLSAGMIPGLEKAAGAASKFLEQAQAIVDNDVLTKAGKQDALVTLARETFEPLGDEVAKAVEAATPKILEAMGNAGEAGAKALFDGFMDAGIEGKLAAVGLILATGTGRAFAGAGFSAAGFFIRAFRRRVRAAPPVGVPGAPVPAPAPAGGGRGLKNAARRIGRAGRRGGPWAAAAAVPPAIASQDDTITLNPNVRGGRVDRDSRRGRGLTPTGGGTSTFPAVPSPFGFKARADSGLRMETVVAADQPIILKLNGEKLAEANARVYVRHRERGG